jgi:hypothetical protein
MLWDDVENGQGDFPRRWPHSHSGIWGWMSWWCAG